MEKSRLDSGRWKATREEESRRADGVKKESALGATGTEDSGKTGTKRKWARGAEGGGCSLSLLLSAGQHVARCLEKGAESGRMADQMVPTGGGGGKRQRRGDGAVGGRKGINAASLAHILGDDVTDSRVPVMQRCQ